MSTTTTTVRNGIDVDQLVATVGAVEEDPEVAAFTFRASSRWEGGTRNVGEIRSFAQAGEDDDSRDEAYRLVGDEPPVLLGDNAGPNAVELVLQALGFCYAVGCAANAAARGIELTRMDYEVEGDLDLRPFLGVDGTRPGFTEIRVQATVSSPNASEDELAELCQYVQDTSPVRDTLAERVAVTTSMEVV